MKRYEILLFDADNTVLDFTAAEASALKKVLTAYDLPVDYETVSTYAKINDGLWKMLERGEIEKTRLRYRRFEDFLLHFGYDRPAREIADAYTAALSEECILIPGMADLCRSLSSRYRMYIVTNGIGAVQRSRWARTEIRDCFLDLFISEELGYEKPAREYFDIVAERIPHFDREKTLLIGDSLSSDMRGGQNAGIDTCWFCRSDEAKPPEGLTVTYTVRNAEELYALLG